MAYTKQARQHAKDNKMALFAAEIDGRPAKNGVGKYSCHGPCDCAMARSLWLFCVELSRDISEKPINPRKAFDKYFPNGKPIPIEREEA